MTTLRTLSFALFVSTAALAANAQSQPMPAASAPMMPMAGAQMPMASASMPQDCATPMTAKHDHGADKGTPMPKSKAMSGPCAPAKAASAPKTKHEHTPIQRNR